MSHFANCHIKFGYYLFIIQFSDYICNVIYNLNTMKIKLLILAFFIILLTSKTYSIEDRIHLSEPSTNVLLANEGITNFSVVTSSNADVKVKQIAILLADYLYKINGASFSVVTGAGTSGISIGVPSDFPELPFNSTFDLTHPAQKQGYEIKSHSNGVYIIGATPIAVEYAVFDFLDRIGYRHFFPMAKWEIIPSKRKLEFGLHIKEVPDFYSRNIWPGYGVWSEFSAITTRRNIAVRNGGITLNSGHAYDAIVNANKAVFNAHPEYYSLVNGKRRIVSQEIKFCLESPALIDLVSNYVVKQFQNNPNLESASIEPSDGGGWCECQHCTTIGTPSTRAVYLANIVAQKVRQNFSGKKLGMYAYNMHSPPPAIDVDQDVVVSVATNFIAGGMQLDDIINGWEAKKAVLGLREYYDVYIWSKMLPGKSAASNISYLKTTIPNFYNRGSRYMSAEASDDWGPCGLGYYIANRLLWDIDENVDEIIDDFCQQSFGPAALAMKNYFTLCLDGSSPKLLSEDLIGRMYRYLGQARAAVTENELILSRIDDLVLYTRYSELYMKFDAADSANKQAAFNNFMNFIATLKNYRIIHTLAIDRGSHWKNMSPNPNTYTTPNWNSSAIVYTSEQINTIVNQGIANNELLDFEPIGFSTNLVPVKFQYDKPMGTLDYRRGTFEYYLWVYDDLKPINIQVTGGLIYGTRGNVKVSLYKLGGASEGGEYETLIQTDESTPPDKLPHVITLTPNQAGLHLIKFSDGMDRTLEVWQNYDKIFSGTFNNDLEVDGTYYFYVPVGTSIIGMFHKLWRGQLYDPYDNKVYDFTNTSDYQSFPVPQGMDGKIWYFKQAKGIVNLMTVPSYFSLNPKFFLLPEEVVVQDGLNDPTNQQAFITVWEPTTSSLMYPGIGTNYTIKVRNLTLNKLEQTIVDATSVQNSAYIINNLIPGNKYSIEVTPGDGLFNGFRSEKIATDRYSLKEIKQWGSIVWRADMAFAFKDCNNLELTATDKPDLSGVTVLAGLFQNCTSLKGNSSITTWDMQKAFNIGLMFGGATQFNQPLNWNVKNVRHARSVFEGATNFNQSLASWELNELVDMYGIFNDAGIDCSNYANMLQTWASNINTTPKERTVGAKGIRYNITGKQYRDIITKPVSQGGLGWTIMEDIYDSSCTTRVQSLEDENILVKISENIIAVSNLMESEKVVLYDVTGKMISTQKAQIGQVEFSIPQKGIFLIYLPGQNTYKKIIK